MIESKDIPQADLLSKVVAVVELIYNGAVSDEEIASGLDFDSRQGRYYRRAAEMLGFIVTERNVSQLTEKGEQFVKTSGNDRKNLLIENVLSLPIFSITIEILDHSPNGLNGSQLASELVKNTFNMAMATITRRTSSIFGWLEELGLIVRRGNNYYSNKYAIPPINQTLIKKTSKNGQTFSELKAIRFTQNEIPFLIFIASSGEIYNKFDVSRRIENKEEGYQRSFSKSRVNDIRRFVSVEHGVLPNSILVNLDKNSYEYSESENKLYLNDSGSAGFIIDGQHRVKGSYEADPEILLPVVATLELSIQDQARLFIKINRTQKGVPSSLYLDLLELTEGAIEDLDSEDLPAERRAVELAKQLNDDVESPLFDLIRTTGDSGRGISLSQFVSLLIEYVDPGKGKFVEFGFEEQYKLFKLYFKAIKATFLDVWNQEDTPIFKTTVFGGLVKAFHEIFSLATRDRQSISVQGLMSVLEPLSDFNFAKLLTGTGVQAQVNASTLIISYIKKKNRMEGGSKVRILDGDLI